MDKYIQAEYAAGSILNAGNLIGGWLAFVLSTACAALAVSMAADYDREQLALALTYCFLVPLFAAFVGQVSNMTAMFYQSLDRLLEVSADRDDSQFIRVSEMRILKFRFASQN